MKILISGASGNIGSTLIKLLPKEDCEIIGISSRKKLNNAGNVKYIFHDWKNPSLEFELPEVDIIVHLAGQTSAYHAISEPGDDLVGNLLFPIKLIEKIRHFRNPPTFILAGSMTEYGINTELKLNENTNANPSNLYDLGKVTLENYLRLFVQYGFLKKSVTLRLANVYGGTAVSQKDRSFLDRSIIMALEGESLICYGNGNYIRDYIHINDVVSAIIKVINNNNTAELYNVGSGIGTTIYQILNQVKDAVEAVQKSKIDIIFQDFPSNSLEIERRNHIADISKISNDLGWIPKYGLNEGIMLSIDEWHNRGAG